MAKHPVPKKKQAKSRTRRRHSAYVRGQQENLLKVIDQSKDIERRSEKLRAEKETKRSTKVTTIKAD
jgi:hypothetical protein